MPVLGPSSTRLPHAEGTESTPLSVLATIQALRLANFHNDQHCERMGVCAGVVGRELGLDHPTCERLEVAATLHDVGKIGLPDEILNKSGPLSSDERRRAQSHCVIGCEILSQDAHPTLSMAADVALHHHERWDGRGYPDQLARSEITLPARIVAVVDVFDALSSSRPYKRPWTKDEVFAELIKGAGSAFDPDVVDILVQLRPQVLSLYRSWEAAQA